MKRHLKESPRAVWRGNIALHAAAPAGARARARTPLVVVGALMVSLVFTATAVARMRVESSTLPPRECTHDVPPGPGASRSCTYYEGFEGAFPPNGWTQQITYFKYRWRQDSGAPYAGTYAARVAWQDNRQQNEVLAFTHTVEAGEHLLFATMGSKYWTANANFTAEIDGAVVFDFYNDFPGASYEYGIVDIDLSPYVGGPVEIAFRYAGRDGADHYFDAVCIGSPPSPPTNDTCAGAIHIPCGPFTITGSLEFANNDYDPGSGGCTGYSAAGSDLVYYATLGAGDVLTVTMTTDGFDDSIYLITDCGDPAGSCVAGDDAYPDGSTFTFTATAGGTYYLVADAYSGQGDFTLTGSITCTSDPDITVVKSASTASDPVNGSTNPKAIPGATILYTVTATNSGTGATDVNSVLTTDPIPDGTALFVGDIDGPGSGPVLFQDGATPSGLAYEFTSLSSTTDDIDFSDDDGVSYVYVPTPDGDGCDDTVTHLRVGPGGAFAGSDGMNHPSFSLLLRVRVR
ncbi:MAG: hypothetical protein ABIK85_03535 [Candidatus Eisenbacteria bacterium]